MQSVTVIIPAFNEEEGIGNIVTAVKTSFPEFEILVISDGSTDNTAQVAEAAGATVIEHPYNIGNGAAVKTGIRAASGDIILMLDADGQHPPENIRHLLEKMDKHKMAVGARTWKSPVSAFRTLGNTVMRYFAMYLTDMYIADLTSGFRAVYRDVALEFIHLLPNKYSYPTTLTMSLLKEGYPVAWVPMDNIGKRKTGRSNIRPFQDGIRFMNIMVRITMLFSPQKVFLPIGMIFLLAGVYFAIDTIRRAILEPSAVMLIMIGVFVILIGLVAEQIAVLRRELNQRHH
jgi:glycosyltransferase involved in cell wall biosynthesis